MRKHTSFATHPTAAPTIPAVTIGLDLSDTKPNEISLLIR
jgi:hypothetical protein